MPAEQIAAPAFYPVVREALDAPDAIEVMAYPVGSIWIERAAYAALSFLAWTKANDWASSLPEDPPDVRVIGMDFSTDELISFMRPAEELGPSPRSVQ
ncbi:MAG: hypothetical protein WEA77_05620 [Hyphomonas sp.]|uniref:hypothetical protein n=1 Tax=Hyphomonas sp. TaxID=87 RepID=UPI0034A09BD5